MDDRFGCELAIHYTQWRRNRTQPFPAPSKMSMADYLETYNHIACGSQIHDVSIKLEGTTRCDQPLDNSSSQTVVFHLCSGDAQVNVVADPSNLKVNANYFSKLYNYMRTGIAVTVSGFPGKSESGDLYVLATEIDFSIANAIQRPKRPLAAAAITAAGASYAATISEHDIDVARKRKKEVEVERKRKKEVYRIRSKFVKYMRKFLCKSEFMKVKTSITLDMWSCMHPDPELWFQSLVLGGICCSGAGNHFRTWRTNFAQKSEYTACTFFKSFRREALMELTEQMLSGIIRDLTGGYKIKYHANGLDEEPIEIDFSLPFRRINLIEELERKANLNLPEDLSSECTNAYLSDTCTKYCIECPPPRSSADLLNKLVEKFVEADCISPTFITNHPNLKLSSFGDAGLTDHFELFINKNIICSGYVVLEDPKVPYRREFPTQLKEQAHSTSLGQRVKLNRTGWWLWAFDRIIMMLTDKQEIKEVDCSIYMGYSYTHKKKKQKKLRTRLLADTINSTLKQSAA